MNIQQFQYVLAVVDSKNFESAAERCYVTQSTLSTMINRFENEIGIKIFNRKTKPVSITKEGQELIERLRIIVSEIGNLEDLVQQLKGEMVGVLRIGVIPTVAPSLLPLFLPKFTSAFPDVDVLIREIPTKEIVKSLKDRTLDVGILALPIIEEDLFEEELYIEPFSIYDYRENKPNGKIGLDELDYTKLLLLQEGHCLRNQVVQICEQSKQVSNLNTFNFQFEFGSMDSLLRFTKANKGMTIIPQLAVLDLSSEEQKHVSEFKEPIPSRSIGLITHKYFVKKRLAQELSRIITASVSTKIKESKSTVVFNP